MTSNLNSPCRHLWFVLAFVAIFGWVKAAELTVLGSSEIDAAALNFSSGAANFSQNVNGRSYQRSPLSSFKGYQYATYYDSNRNVCLARRKLPSGAWDILRFTDYTITNNDSHNVTALGICAGDGTIHLSFDHHKDPLNYRVSEVGAATKPESVTWSTSLFSGVTDSLGAVGRLVDVTYPTFFSAPNGNLMFYYRLGGSGSGDGMIQEYNGSTSEWSSGLGKFISRSGSYTGAVSTNSTSRNPYLNGISYAGTRLHASWGWRENSGGTRFNHDLNYTYSDDDGRTWKNSTGAQIGVTNSSFIKFNSPGLVVAAIPQNIGLSNQYTHYAYPDGSCHVIVQHKQSGTNNNRYHHYWRNAAGVWSSEVLPLSGSRPKLVGDDNRELFLAYVAGGTLRVAKGSPNATRTSWSWASIRNESGRSEGGEGHIDVARWEKDRVLSLYGQVKAPSNGNPTALSVFDYQVSAKAILPNPSDGTKGADISPSLEWTAGLGAISHRIYLGTSRTAVEVATPSSPEFQGEQAAASFIPAQPLAKYTTYYWRIDEVESGSLVHPGLIWSFTTVADFLPGESTDASVKEDLGVVDSSSNATLLGTGGINPWVDRSTVYVFRLPDLGTSAQPFQSASFRFNYVSKQGTLRNNDLYGLGRRSSPDVLGSDYYGQTAVSDPSDATRLQTDILTNATPLGEVTTSPEGDEALVSYLNAQYDSGAGIGAYVFLRLNTAAPKAGIHRASLNMAEAGVDEALRPAIIYSTNREPTVTVVAGWDTWNSNTAPDASVKAAGITATATASGTGGNWSITDNDSDPGRGSSGDQTWGSFEGNGIGANGVTNVGSANMSLTNGKTNGEVTLTITNNGPVDWKLDSFHMDAVAFRPNAARTYALNVLAGSDITVGNVFTSGLPKNDNSSDAITTLNGNLGTSHDVHDDLDLVLVGLPDHTLAPGEVAIIQIAFSNGTGSGGGHHLFLDNVAVSGIRSGFTALQSWRQEHFGTMENIGIAADSFDANGDGESNLLEFATGQDPYEDTMVASGVTLNGEVIEFLYTRSLEALAERMSYHVEWSDTLLPGSWSQSGVVYSLIGSEAETETILASVPVSAEGQRFVRLVVTP